MCQDEILDKLRNALSKLFSEDHDKFLLEKKANERSITHKLAVYLEEEFDGEKYDVDVEYNLVGGKPPKTVDLESLPKNCWGTLNPKDNDAKTVYPDIIVHKRGTSDRNLLAIEVKKSNNYAHKCDRDKLRAYIRSQNFGYRYGVFLRLNVGQTLGVAEAILEPGGNDISGELRPRRLN